MLGGSLGARALNRILPQSLALIDELQRPIVKHQCGVKHLEDCQQAYDKANINADVMPFIDDMKAAYEWADLVVCRAGALTIAELTAAGIASILVPYPYAVDDHQTHNGLTLVDAGAAKLIQETELTAELLAEQLVMDSQQLLTMAKAARRLVKPDSAQVIADICMEAAHG